MAEPGQPGEVAPAPVRHRPPRRHRAPLFLYYTAFDFSGAYTGTCYRARCDAKLTVPAALAPNDPVLVDMLRGGVYSVSSFDNLPLVDYPLVLADRTQVPLVSSQSRR